MSHQLFYPKQRITSDETTHRLPLFRGLRQQAFRVARKALFVSGEAMMTR